MQAVNSVGAARNGNRRLPRRAGLIACSSAAVLAVGAMLPVGAHAATDAWSTSPANANFSGTNWTLGSIIPGAATGTAASGDTLYFGTSGTTTLNNNDTGFNFAGLVFNPGASQYNISGNSFTLTGNILNYSATTQIIGAPIVLGANESIYTAAGGTTNLSGGISGTGFGLTTFGTGTLNLTGSNSYTGTTTASGGALNLNFGSASPVISTSSLLVMAGGKLNLIGFASTADTQTFASTTFSSGGSAITLNQNSATSLSLALGTATRSVGGAATFNFNPSSNTISVTAGTGAALLNGLLPWAAVNNSGTAANASPAGYTFATISGGNIAAYTGATLEANAVWPSGNGNTISYDLSQTAAVNMGVSRTANTLRFITGGTWTVSSGAALTTNALMAAGSAAVTYNPNVSIGVSNELVLDAASANLTLTGNIANNGSTASAVTAMGASTVTLTGTSSFTGDLIVNGTLAASTGQGAAPTASDLGALQPAANRNFIVNSGGTLSLTGGNVLGTGGSTNSLSNNTLVANAGGVFQTGLNGAGAGWWNKVGNVNLNGGTILVGSGANTTNFQALALIGNVNVSGSVPSTITSFAAANSASDGIHLGQNATASQVVTFNVGDVTNDANPDLTVTVPLINTSASLAASGFTKTGTGTILLTGSSAYTGPTTISAGTLQLGDGTTGHDGEIAATSGVTNNGTLTFNRFGTSTAPYAITGTGNVLKIGSGNQTLTGNSSYTGVTSINAGTLTLASGGNITGGQVNISGGTFAANGSSSVSAPVVLQSGAISTVDLTFNSFNFNSLNVSGGSSAFNMEAGTSNQTDQINISNALTLSSAGATINLLGAVAGQTYNLMSFGSATFNGNAFTNSSGTSSAEGLTLVTPFGVGGTLTITPNNVQVITTGGAAPSAAYWTGAKGANWTDNSGGGGNFTTTLNGSTLISALPASTTDVYFANTGATNLSTTLGTQNFDINSLNFLSTTGAVTIANGSFGTTLTLEGGGLNVASGAGAVTLSTTTLTLNADQTWTNSSANPVLVSASVGGSHGLTLTGGGQFNLSNTTNAYTGGTLVTGGSTLAVTAPTGLGVTNGNLVLDNGTLITNSAATFTLATAVTINSGGATIDDIGAGQLWMNIGGILSGSGDLTIQGTGTLASSTAGNVRITSANTYSGSITVQSGGSLEYGVSGAISSNLVTVGNQGEFITNAGTFNPINVNVSGGTNSVISFENGATGSLTGNVYLGANAVIGVRDWYNYGAATGGSITGTISGTGGLTVTSGTTTGGVLTLSSTANTYTGSTTISGSTVVVSELDVAANPSSIGSAPAAASNLILDNGILADNGSNTQTTDRMFTVTTGGGGINSSGGGTVSFTASGPIVMSGTGARTFTLTGSNTGANTLNPSITDNGGATALVKAGAGEWVLTGSNTYSGATSINAGTLITGNLPNTSAVNVGAAGAAAGLVLNGSGTNPLGTGTITMDTTGNASTANFQFSGGVTLTNPIYFAARNNATVGIQSVSGNNTLSGPITLGSGGSSYAFESDAGSLNLTNTTTSTIGLNKVVTFQGASGGSVAIPFNGAGGVTVTGSGAWTFSGSNTYTGPTVVSGGTLALASTGSLSGTSGINISNGAVFDISAKPGFALTSTQTLFGSGTINGAYTQTLGTLAPGGVAAVGTLSETGNLNLAGGSLSVDLNGNSGSDLISVTGNLALGGPMTLATTFLNSTSVGQQFTLINYSGTLTGSLSNLASTTRGYSLSNTSNSVILTVTTTGAANLNWNSSTSGVWDVTTSYNWFNSTSNMQDIFYQGDAVTFGDTPGVQTAIAINTTVNPASTTINSSNNAYTFNGSGGIGGTGALIKSGSSVLTLDTSNSYTGGTFINGGTIAINSNTSLGALTSPVTIGAGTLEVTTSITAARPFNVSSASSTIQVDPGVTYSITSNISDGATAGTLVKTGTGILALTGTNTYSGGTNIGAGAITASGTLGAANSPLLIGPNGTYNISGGTNTNVVTGTGNIYSIGTTISGDESAFAGTFTHNSTTASTSFTTAVSTSAAAAYVMSSTSGSLQGFIAGNGGMTLNLGSLSGIAGSLFRGSNSGTAGTTTLSVGALNQSTGFSGSILDGVNVKLALNKVGSASLTLAGSNTYSQGTNLSGGTLILASAGAYPTNTALSVSSGATLQVANHGSNTVYVPTLSSLSNSGTIDLTNNAMLIHNGDFPTVFSQVQAGYHSGNWNGTSGSGVITSSLAAADPQHLTAVGMVDNVTGTYAGQSLVSTDILLKTTYYGDANLSGTVDSADYSLIDGGYLSGGTLTGWQNGDFNYDGVINGSDYTLIDNAFNMQGASLASQIANPSAGAAAQVAGAVPEPASLGLIGIGAIGLLSRRRRR